MNILCALYRTISNYIGIGTKYECVKIHGYIGKARNKFKIYDISYLRVSYKKDIFIYI